jgi:hypothetical protein
MVSATAFDLSSASVTRTAFDWWFGTDCSSVFDSPSGKALFVVIALLLSYLCLIDCYSESETMSAMMSVSTMKFEFESDSLCLWTFEKKSAIVI